MYRKNNGYSDIDQKKLEHEALQKNLLYIALLDAAVPVTNCVKKDNRWIIYFSNLVDIDIIRGILENFFGKTVEFDYYSKNNETDVGSSFVLKDDNKIFRGDLTKTLLVSRKNIECVFKSDEDLSSSSPNIEQLITKKEFSIETILENTIREKSKITVANQEREALENEISEIMDVLYEKCMAQKKEQMEIHATAISRNKQVTKSANTHNLSHPLLGEQNKVHMTNPGITDSPHFRPKETTSNTTNPGSKQGPRSVSFCLEGGKVSVSFDLTGSKKLQTQQ